MALQYKKPRKVAEGEPPRAPDATLAPWPQIDKYPSVLGSNVNLQVISNVFRLSQTGYRQQYVDLLNELLEREPHGYACLAQRTINVVGGRVEIVPAKTKPGSADEKIATMLADNVAKDFHNIADLDQSLFALEFAGLYYAVSGSEISWANDGDIDWQWRPTRLHFIHSRRLSYPDPSSWHPHIWDQGMVRGWNDPRGDAPTQQIFGLPITEAPGKFIIHTPQLRADYPTRDGLGRQLAYWFALKAIGARGASQYVERFGKPFAIAYYATQPDGQPRSANNTDIAQADAAMGALGAGSLSGATLPNSINIDLKGPGLSTGRIGITHAEWINICDSQISKVIKGQTFTTESGTFGSRNTASVGQSSELRIAAYDAKGLAATIKRDLIFWMVKLNAPEHVRLCPNVVIHVEDEPNENARVDLAVKAAGAGMPIDADALADEIGMPLVKKPAGDDRNRRMAPLAPMKPADLAALEDPVAALVASQALAEATLVAKSKASKPTDGEDEVDDADNEEAPPAH